MSEALEVRPASSAKRRSFQSSAWIQALDGVEGVTQPGLIVLRCFEVVGVARFVQLRRELIDVFDLRGESCGFVGREAARLSGQSSHQVAHFEGGFVNRFEVFRGDDFIKSSFGRRDFCPRRGCSRERRARCSSGRGLRGVG